MRPLARQVAALLFCAPQPAPIGDLADALEVEVQDVDEALAEIADRFDENELGIVLREVAVGHADLDALPDFRAFEPSAQDAEELRAKLLKAGEQRAS